MSAVTPGGDCNKKSWLLAKGVKKEDKKDIRYIWIRDFCLVI